MALHEDLDSAAFVVGTPAVTSTVGWWLGTEYGVPEADVVGTVLGFLLGGVLLLLASELRTRHDARSARALAPPDPVAELLHGPVRQDVAPLRPAVAPPSVPVPPVPVPPPPGETLGERLVRVSRERQEAQRHRQ